MKSGRFKDLGSEKVARTIYFLLTVAPAQESGVTLDFALYKSDGTIIANPGTITKKVSIDGGDVADIAASVTEENTTYGQCSLVLAAGEMNGDRIWFYIKDDTPLPKQFEYIKDTLDALKAKPGRKLCEHEMGVTTDLRPCGFMDKDVWCRGIADLLIIDDDNLTARVVDYKTGNNKYPDREQLKLMALMVFTHFPHIRKVKKGNFE